MHVATNQVEDPEIPSVPSPYAGTILSVKQNLCISSYWFATNFLWGALLAIMLPKEIKELFPFNRVQALSLLTAFAALVALFVPLISGALTDRCISLWGRRRPFMVYGIIINLVGLFAMAIAVSTADPMPKLLARDAGFFQVLAKLTVTPAFLYILASYMLVQFGNNIAMSAYSGIIPDLVPENQRGTASGYMAVMSQIGTLFGAFMSGFVLKSLPIPAQYAVLGIVLVLFSLPTLLGIRETPLPSKPPKIIWGKYIKSLWISPKLFPDFAWVWITRALVMMGFYAIQPFVNYYLGDVIGLKNVEEDAAVLLAIILIASSISGIVGGKVSDRIGRKKVVIASTLIIAVASITFIFCKTLPMALGSGLLFGLGYGAYISVDWALGTDVLPSKSHASKEMAVWHISMTLPQSLAGPIAGFMISSFGVTEKLERGEIIPTPHYATMGYVVVFIFMAICFTLSAIFIPKVKGAT